MYKHNNVSRKLYSFFEVKLWQSLKKTCLEKDNIIFVIKNQHTVLAVAIKYPVPASQHRIKVSIIFTEDLNLCPWKTNTKNLKTCLAIKRLDFLKSPSSCLFSTRRKKDFSYLIGANITDPTCSYVLTNQRSPGYPLARKLSIYAQEISYHILHDYQTRKQWKHICLEEICLFLH